MAWVRIEDAVTEHRKHLKAGPAACWLWVCGLAYCQRQLSDGYIPDEALMLLGCGRDARKKDSGSRLASVLVAVGLWERCEGGYRVHDYHDYNHTREEALEKQEVNRVQRRQAGIASGLSRRRTVERKANGPVERTLNPLPSPPIPLRERDASVSQTTGKRATDPFTHQETANRAGQFIDRYQELYVAHRKGARYAVKPVRDYAAAVTLCDTWDDDRRLDKLAIIFLTTDHHFAEEGSRTIPQFLALASWCDGKLAEHEAKKGSAA